MQKAKAGITKLAIAILLAGCGQAPPPAAQTQASLPARPKFEPTLSRIEVIEKFRARATAKEIQEFERLTAAGGPDSETRALELVLFKLKSDELSQVGISQSESDGRVYWFLATSVRFADGGKAFDQALAHVGVSPGGVFGHGMVGWTVPREKFFVARRALLVANLSTNEIWIAEPQFSLPLHHDHEGKN